MAKRKKKGRATAGSSGSTGRGTPNIQATAPRGASFFVSPIVLLGTLFSVVVLVVAMKATVTINSPEEPTFEAIDKLCCFTPDDVSLKFAGSAPGIPYLTVDNFFCENALKQLVGHAAEDQRLFTDTQASYPGKALRINNWIKNTNRRGGLVQDRLSKNEHLQCLRRALLIARERDDWTEEEEEALQILERGEFHRKGIERASGDETGKRFRKLQGKMHRRAEQIGFFKRGVSERALYTLAGNASLDRYMANSSSIRMSFLDRRLTTKPSHIHIDPTSIVINIHLTSGHEDTGTSFWRPLQQDAEHKRNRALPGTPRVEFCGGQEWNLIWCTEHLYQHAKELRRRLGKGEQIPFPAGTDFTEQFEQYHMLPWKRNRASIYSGRIPHSYYLPPEAEDRIINRPQKISVDGGSQQPRLMLQSFLDATVHRSQMVWNKILDEKREAIRRSRRQRG